MIKGIWSFKILILLLSSFSFSSFCQADTSGSNAVSTWWSEAARPFAGTVLRGVTEYTPASQYVSEILAPAFERETGIKVILELVSWEEMYTRSIQDVVVGAGTYDFVYIEQDIVYAYISQDFLVNLTKEFQDHSQLSSPYFSFDDFTSFLDYFKYPVDEDIFGVPMESFLKVYMYRKDLFEDPEIMKAFKGEFGYSLAPAQTFEEFRDISLFFTNWGRLNGLELWGTTLQASLDHPASFYELFESVLPGFGVYDWGINLNTWKSTSENGGMLDSEEAINALAFWLDMLQYCPPETFGSTWDETVLTFASGRIAHCWMAGENAVWFAMDENRSRITGKVGVALPPVAAGVMEAAQAGNGYIGYYDGGAFGIPRTSRNIEATLLWLQYVGHPGVQVDWTLNTGRVVHSATMEAPRIQELDRSIGGYFSLMKEHEHLFAGAPSFPYHAALREIIAPYIYRSIRREISARDALTEAAIAVDKALGTLTDSP